MRTIALLFIASVASAQPSPHPESDLRRKVEELEKKQRELERRLQANEADNTVPRFRFGRGGFVFGTADGKSEIRLRAVINLDARGYLGPGSPPATFVVRRARPFIDGTLFDLVDFRILPDFAMGQAQLLDAYVELHPWRWLRLRGGRFMIPVGLEWLKKDTTIPFLERSLATDLVSYRSLGLMLWGELGAGTFAYQLALINNVPDEGNGLDFDAQSQKEYVGRVFLRPFAMFRRARWSDLGFGVSGSYAQVKSSSNLPPLRSPGQQPIFTYLTHASSVPATAASGAPDLVVANGDRWRVSPQLYWYAGPFGLIAEYVLSSQRVQRLDSSDELRDRAWNLTASFVLTLERNSYDGVVPRRPVDFRHFAVGAWELVLRYSELRIDPKAFPLYADPASSVSAARELAAGINWYVTAYVKFMVSYHRTDFKGGSPVGDRPPENALMGRFQLAL